MAKQISELNWEKRLIVISYEKQNDGIFTKTKKFISDNKCKIEDRNLEIIFFEKFENKDFVTPKFINKKYGMWLIGYDGMIKDYSYDDKILLRLFNLIEVLPFNTLTTTLCIKHKATIIFRGLRAVSDFEYEFQLAGMNRKMNDRIETVFLMSDPENQVISSKFVKEIAKLKGKINNFVTKSTQKEIKIKYE